PRSSARMMTMFGRSWTCAAARGSIAILETTAAAIAAATSASAWRDTSVRFHRLLRLDQLTELRNRAVDRQDLVHLQVALLDVVEQVRRIRLHRGARTPHVGLHQDAFLREVGHQQRIAVRAALDVEDLDCTGRV